MSRAELASDRAAQWLIAQEDGPWTDEDQAALDAWLGEADGNKAAYWRLKHSWREADRIRALGPGTTGDVEPGSAYRTRRWWIPASAAASIAAVVALGVYVAQPVPSPRPHLAHRDGVPAETVAAARFATPVGGRKAIDLADGSKVELNTASQLRTAVDDDRREVWLDKGEAYFEVRHIEGRPFVVHAGNREVTVLGTKFSVRRDGAKVTVSVLEGRVRVDELNGTVPVRAAVISSGDIALARGASTLVTDRSAERVENSLAWRSGMLSFDRTRLADVAAEFNRYNLKPMVVTDPEAADIRIGGMFPASEPQAFVRLLRDAYGLKVEESADAIKISS